VYVSEAEITCGANMSVENVNNIGYVVSNYSSHMHPLRVNKMTCRIQGLFGQITMALKHCLYLNGR
jgi:hypothetical protein